MEKIQSFPQMILEQLKIHMKEKEGRKGRGRGSGQRQHRKNLDDLGFSNDFLRYYTTGTIHERKNW